MGLIKLSLNLGENPQEQISLHIKEECRAVSYRGDPVE